MTTIIIIAAIIIFVVAAYKTATKKEDIDLNNTRDIQDVAARIWLHHAAKGFKMTVCKSMSSCDKLSKFITDGKTSQGLDPDQLTGLCIPDLGDDINNEDAIYIFIDGIKKQAELIKKLGKKVSNRKIVETVVLHECRHSQQAYALRKQGRDLQKAYAFESACQYGKGPMEADAVAYSAMPNVYGLFVRSSFVANCIGRKMDDPIFTAQYSISKMFG